jgi:hypothetical protein
MQGKARTEASQSSEQGPQHESRLLQFAQHHPTLAVLGAAGIGLFGGLELALGVVIGAGMLALAGRRSAPPEHDAPESAHTVRQRANQLIENAHLRDRARAVVQAARGQIAPIGSNGKSSHSGA